MIQIDMKIYLLYTAIMCFCRIKISFLIALLSVLGSPATFVKALAYLAHDYTRIGFIRASAYLTISLAALESRKLRQNQFCCQTSFCDRKEHMSKAGKQLDWCPFVVPPKI
jgi:hypothetical protein